MANKKRVILILAELSPDCRLGHLQYVLSGNGLETAVQHWSAGGKLASELNAIQPPNSPGVLFILDPVIADSALLIEKALRTAKVTVVVVTKNHALVDTIRAATDPKTESRVKILWDGNEPSAENLNLDSFMRADDIINTMGYSAFI